MLPKYDRYPPYKATFPAAGSCAVNLAVVSDLVFPASFPWGANSPLAEIRLFLVADLFSCWNRVSAVPFVVSLFVLLDRIVNVFVNSWKRLLG